jgi:hypothetical protein
MDKVFTDIYENCHWGNNKVASYKGSSGGGSDIEFNINTYVPFITKYIIDNNIKTIVDLGCGDFRCGPLIYNDLTNITYYGYDAYNGVILHNKRNQASPKYNFFHLDFFNKKEDIVSADLCILKDVLQHWPTKDIYTFLDYIVQSKKFKHILICNCRNQTNDNMDIHIGGWRPLSFKFLPLKKYNAIRLYKYHTKEVCVLNP